MVDMNRAQQGVQFSTSFLWKHWKAELDEQQQNNDCEVILQNAKSVKATKHKKQRSNKVSKERTQSKICKWKQTFQLGTFDVGEGVLDPGEWLNVGDAGSITDRGLMVPVCEKAGRKVPKDEHEPNCGMDRQVWVRVLNIGE